MKIAISGKGGVGKTLLASLLARVFSKSGYSVIAIDADPDTNLAATLGYNEPQNIIPVSDMKELIEERTNTKPGEKGGFFRLNPHVDDLPDKYSVKIGGIRLLVMGQIKKGGSGCYCPENSLLSALLSHLLVARDEVVIMDMAAGIEHLGRGTARSVDMLIIVVEPRRASMETAHRIKSLARDIGIENISIVGNKVKNEQERAFINKGLKGINLLGFIPYDQALVDADISGMPVLDASRIIDTSVKEIYNKLVSGSVAAN